MTPAIVLSPSLFWYYDITAHNIIFITRVRNNIMLPFPSAHAHHPTFKPGDPKLRSEGYNGPPCSLRLSTRPSAFVRSDATISPVLVPRLSRFVTRAVSRSASPFTRRSKNIQKTELLGSPEQGWPTSSRQWHLFPDLRIGQIESTNVDRLRAAVLLLLS